MTSLSTPRLAALLFLAAAPALAADLVLPRPSPKASVMQTVGLTDVTVTYSRPGVKGRVIWGDLVPYDKVWRTGANEATVVTFSTDVKVAGQPLPAGSYSLHTIPTAGDWTIIFNKQAEQWGSYSYDQAKDALRVQVTPRRAEHEEWMSFSFPTMTTGGSTELVLRWEKIAVPIAIDTGLTEQGFANIDKAVAAAKADAWRLPYRAADFALSQDSRLDEAMTWIDQSLALEENYSNLGVKARLLAKKGDVKGAIALGEKAVRIAKEKNSPPDTAAVDRLVADWKAGKK